MAGVLTNILTMSSGGIMTKKAYPYDAYLSNGVLVTVLAKTGDRYVVTHEIDDVVECGRMSCSGDCHTFTSDPYFVLRVFEEPPVEHMENALKSLREQVEKELGTIRARRAELAELQKSVREATQSLVGLQHKYRESLDGLTNHVALKDIHDILTGEINYIFLPAILYMKNADIVPVASLTSKAGELYKEGLVVFLSYAETGPCLELLYATKTRTYEKDFTLCRDYAHACEVYEAYLDALDLTGLDEDTGYIKRASANAALHGISLPDKLERFLRERKITEMQGSLDGQVKKKQELEERIKKYRAELSALTCG